MRVCMRACKRVLMQVYGCVCGTSVCVCVCAHVQICGCAHVNAHTCVRVYVGGWTCAPACSRVGAQVLAVLQGSERCAGEQPEGKVSTPEGKVSSLRAR